MATQKFVKTIKNKDSDDKYEKKHTFSFITSELNSLNIERDYKMLKSKISLGKDRLDLDVLSEAIDSAPEWAFKASQIYLNAKDKLAKFEDLTFKIKYAELSDEATQALEKLKREKKLSGQVTKEKIENWIILNKKEYIDLLDEKRELEITVELFKSLSNQFESKKSLLQTQGRLYEKKRFIIEKGGKTDE